MNIFNSISRSHTLRGSIISNKGENHVSEVVEDPKPVISAECPIFNEVTIQSPTFIDFISRIYPGAEIRIGDDILTVRQFRYMMRSDNDIPKIIIYESSSIRNIKSPLNEHVVDHIKQENRPETSDHILIYKKEGVYSGDNIVDLLSSSHEDLRRAIESLNMNIFIDLMSFMQEENMKEGSHDLTEKQFTTILKRGLSKFEYFLSRDRNKYIVEAIERSFYEKIIHSKDCAHFGGTIFGDGHVCDETSHMRVLLSVAINPKIAIHATKNNCLGAVIVVRQQSQLIHIHPGGFLISGNCGQGICRHPLTRIIFWFLILIKRPRFISIFNTHYLSQLNDDLIANKFIETPCGTIKEMIKRFNTQICVKCGEESATYSYFDIRTFNSSCQAYGSLCDSHKDHYNYHLLLFSVLRNGWNGSSQEGWSILKYRDVKQRVKFVTGEILSFRECDYPHYIQTLFSDFLSIFVNH